MRDRETQRVSTLLIGIVMAEVIARFQDTFLAYIMVCSAVLITLTMYLWLRSLDDIDAYGLAGAFMKHYYREPYAILYAVIILIISTVPIVRGKIDCTVCEAATKIVLESR